jgi:hypothetical protein
VAPVSLLQKGKKSYSTSGTRQSSCELQLSIWLIIDIVDGASCHLPLKMICCSGQLRTRGLRFSIINVLVALSVLLSFFLWLLYLSVLRFTSSDYIFGASKLFTLDLNYYNINIRKMICVILIDFDNLDSFSLLIF